MIQYEVVPTQDVQCDKTTGNVEVLARVMDVSDGSKKKADGGNVVFRHRGATDEQKPLVNGAAKLTFDKPREDDKQLIRVDVEYTDPRGITASESILVEIPAKKGQHGADTRPKYTLVLERPAAPEPLDGHGVAFNFVVRLTGQADRTGKTVKLFLDNVPHDAELVTDRAGEAFTRVEFDRQKRDRTVRVSARADIGGKLFTSHPQTITIVALNPETPKNEWKSRLDLELTAKRIMVGEDQYRFRLEAHLTRTEYCVKGEKKGEERAPRNVPQIPVFFKTNWKEIGEPEDAPITDKLGKTSLTTVVVTSKQFDEPITFSAEVAVGQDADENPILIPSNRVEEVIPAATKVPDKPAPVKKIMVQKGDRYNGNTYMFRVTLLSNPDEPSSIVDGIITAYGIPGEMRIGSGEYKPVVEFKGQTANGTANIELKLPPGTMGHVTFGAENTAVVSESQIVKSQTTLQPSTELQGANHV